MLCLLNFILFIIFIQFCFFLTFFIIRKYFFFNFFSFFFLVFSPLPSFPLSYLTSLLLFFPSFSSSSCISFIFYFIAHSEIISFSAHGHWWCISGCNWSVSRVLWCYRGNRVLFPPWLVAGTEIERVSNQIRRFTPSKKIQISKPRDALTTTNIRNFKKSAAWLLQEIVTPWMLNPKT